MTNRLVLLNKPKCALYRWWMIDEERGKNYQNFWLNVFSIKSFRERGRVVVRIRCFILIKLKLIKYASPRCLCECGYEMKVLDFLPYISCLHYRQVFIHFTNRVFTVHQKCFTSHTIVRSEFLFMNEYGVTLSIIIVVYLTHLNKWCAAALLYKCGACVVNSHFSLFFIIYFDMFVII